MGNAQFYGFEFLYESNDKLIKDKYRYHFIDKENKIKRWDNAPHHRKIKSFPHHFHNGSQILPFDEISLEVVLEKIKQFL